MLSYMLVGLIALLAISVALAPLEALGWWASDHNITQRITAVVRQQAPADARPAAAPVERFVVYLAGIGSASGETIFPEEIPFLEYLKARLPTMVVVQDVFPYSVLNKGLTGRRAFAWLWRQVDRLRLNERGRPVGYLINARNLLQLLVSADKRYGPVYNIGMSRTILQRLVAHGYQLGSGVPVTVIGSSGGAQIAVGTATYLHAVLHTPLHVVTLGGVMAGDRGVNFIERLDDLRGEHDVLPALMAACFPRRWPLPSNDWTRAVQEGRIRTTIIGPMKHHANGGYFDPNQRLPDGQTYLERSAEAVVQAILAHHTAR